MKVHPFVISIFLNKKYTSFSFGLQIGDFFNLQNGRKIKLCREIGSGSALRHTCQRSHAKGKSCLLPACFHSQNHDIQGE